MRDALRHGKGVHCAASSGAVYEGTWQNGVRHGQVRLSVMLYLSIHRCAHVEMRNAWHGRVLSTTTALVHRSIKATGTTDFVTGWVG